MPDRMEKKVQERKSVLRITALVRELESAVSLLHNALLLGKKLFLDEALDVIGRAGDSFGRTKQELPEDDDSAGSESGVGTVNVNLRSIAENLATIAQALASKIKEEVLFSDKAMSELNYLFQRSRELLSTTVDLIFAPNVYVATYIREATVELERTADAFVSLHEDRLIGGLCLPKASGIFITCVDSFRHIAWQVQEIAVKVSGR